MLDAMLDVPEQALARSELEDGIRRAVERGDLAAATTAALRGYGAEVFRFMHAMHADEARAGDAFSFFAEGLWRGIARFDWRVSVRAWAYGIARKASLRVRRDEGRRAAHELPVEPAALLASLVQEVRTETLSWLRTGTKSRFAELRETLDPEDREILILRVDQDLSWAECAKIFLADGGDDDDAAVRREAARLRKRFQILKERLLELGRREGLVK